MLREKLNDALKDAMRAREMAAVGTIRLILAKLKEVDIAARTEANREGVADDKILSMMQGMIKQRNESIVLYQKGNRADLADKEKAEIGGMCCAVSGRGGLLVRVDPEAQPKLIDQPNVRPMVMGGRKVTTFVRVMPEGYRTHAGLKKWVKRGVDAVAALKAKPAQRRRS